MSTLKWYGGCYSIPVGVACRTGDVEKFLCHIEDEEDDLGKMHYYLTLACES